MYIQSLYIPPAFLSTDIFWGGIKWLMITGIWLLVSCAIWREDRYIRKTLLTGKPDGDVAQLLAALHRRDMRIWLLLSLLLAIVAVNDIQQDIDRLPPGIFTPPPTPVTLDQPPPPAEPSPAKGPEDKYDRILSRNNAQNLPFSNITEFNERNSKQEAYIDWLKEHYESWLVAYYYLQKCGQAGAQGYEAIRGSLERDLAAAHAPSTVENNILTAAMGSYKEMYYEIPCDSSRLSSSKASYDAFIKQISGITAAPPSSNSSAPPAASSASR